MYGRMPIPATSINSTPCSASLRTGLEQSVWVEFERDSTDSTLPSWMVMIAYESQRPKWGETCELGVASPKQGMAILILPMSTASPSRSMSAVSSVLWRSAEVCALAFRASVWSPCAVWFLPFVLALVTFEQAFSLSHYIISSFDNQSFTVNQ